MVSFSTPTLSLAQRLQEVHQLASALLTRHGLADWKFSFNRSKTQLGLCLFGPKLIQVSVHFVARNGADLIRDTLLHEIAHALVGLGHGHDGVWKAKCREIGARPERLCFEADMPAGRWQAQCGGCGMVHHKHRRPRHLHGWFCRHCGRERGRLTWQPTESTLV